MPKSGRSKSTISKSKSKTRSVPNKSKSKSKSRSKSRSKSKSKMRKTRSVPTKSRSKSRLQKQAESVYGPFREPHETEMRHIKTNYDKYGKVQLGSLDKDKLERSKEKERLIQTEMMDQMRRIDNTQIESRDLGDIPYLKGNVNTYGIEDPDPVLGQMDCRSRANYCSINRDNMAKCNEKEIFNLYIAPCKVEASVNKSIKVLCGLDVIYPDPVTYPAEYTAEFNNGIGAEIKNLDQIMDMEVISYLGRYLSYGYDVNNKELEINVMCDFEALPYLPYLDLDDLITNFGTEYQMWTEDEFIETVENFIGVDEMKRGIESWREDIADSPGAQESIKALRETMSMYVEGSLSWWTIVLFAEIKSVPPDNDNWPDWQGGVNPIFDFLLGLEDSFLEIFTGKIYSNGEWSDRGGPHPTKVGDVIRWIKDPRKREHTYGQLMKMKKLFIKLGTPRFKDHMIIQYFKEFIDLFDVTGRTLYSINEELAAHTHIRQYQDISEEGMSSIQ